jgi:hypothetical protein
MSDARKTDIALIIKRNDENGRPYTRKLPDGRVVPDPLITTRNYNVADDVEIRFSVWDLDEQSLQVRLSGQKEESAFEDFSAVQHERMQQLVRNGQVDAMIRDHENQRTIAELQNRIASGKPNTAND